MNNDPKLLLDLLEDLNTLYRLLGSKEEKNNLFKKINKMLLPKSKSSVIEKNEQILIFLHEHLKSPSPAIAKRLLTTLCHQIENAMKPNEYISAWFTKNMEEVLLGGADFKEAFGLKYSAPGRPPGTKFTPVLQVAAAHEFYLRSGKKATEAKECIENNMGITEKEINRSIASLKIPEYIETGLLEELMKRDYSHIMGYGH